MSSTRGRADEGEFGVGVLYLGAVAVDFVDEQGDGLAVAVGFDGPACVMFRSMYVRKVGMHVGCMLTRYVESLNQPQAFEEEEEDETGPGPTTPVVGRHVCGCTEKQTGRGGESIAPHPARGRICVSRVSSSRRGRSGVVDCAAV